jgi:hypothetical protein
MIHIWINEEKVTEEFLDNLGHYISFDGQLDKAYYLSAEEFEQNQIYLQEFLNAQGKYPVYITFIVYDDQVEEYGKLLKDKGLEYQLIYLEEKRTYYDFTGRHQYHPPCFTAKVSDLKSLKFLIGETYWLPTQNEFYFISYSDILGFEQKVVREWGRKKQRSVPKVKIIEKTTFITVAHDGQGFYLFSNDEMFSTLDGLCSRLPEGTVITQINDTLINNEN